VEWRSRQLAAVLTTAAFECHRREIEHKFH